MGSVVYLQIAIRRTGLKGAASADNHQHHDHYFSTAQQPQTGPEVERQNHQRRPPSRSVDRGLALAKATEDRPNDRSSISLEPERRIELLTCSLRVSCSAV